VRVTSTLLARGSVRRLLACGVGMMCVASSSVSVCVAPGDAPIADESFSFRLCASSVCLLAAFPFVVYGLLTLRLSVSGWLLAITVDVMCVASSVLDVVAF